MKGAAKVVLIIACLQALFADCLAGERAIVLSRAGEYHVMATADGPLEKGEWALWPPIRHDPQSVRTGGRLEVLHEPSRDHILGTDDRGRDVASRLLHGARLSLMLAILCAALASALGMLVALLSLLRAELDLLVRTGCDVLAALPVLLVVLIVRGLLGSESLLSLVLLISVPRAASSARLARDAMQEALAMPFCEAARAIGCSRARLLLQHALPQSFSQMRVAAALTASTAVLSEVALSFLGLGVRGPSWGELLSQAHHNQLAYWLLWPAGVSCALLAWSFGRVAE